MRLIKFAAERKREDSKWSLNRWICDAITQALGKLTEPCEAAPVVQSPDKDSPVPPLSLSPFDLACKIPGLQVGFPEAERVRVEATVIESAPKRNWQAEYRAASEMDPGEAERHIKSVMQSAGLVAPPGFSRMPPATQLRWLEAHG